MDPATSRAPRGPRPSGGDGVGRARLPLTVAGAAQVGAVAAGGRPFLIPVELRRRRAGREHQRAAS
ncbi:hypothetical protein FUT87_21890 [Mitsuaria sp. TWR114]|nr:hypothetical protein FUT87_21890 [Mitsuaria sp. TWR114]